MLYTKGLLTAAGNIVEQAASGNAISVDELQKVMNSSASDEQKTNFFIQYLLSQREWLLDFAKTLVFAIIVFLIGRKIVKVALKITKKTMIRKDVEISVQKFIMSLANFAYNALLIVVIAGILGIGASSIVAVIGSAGLAIGLALQGSLSNLAGGVLILLLKPFKVGDYIIAAGAEGNVQSIDIFYTRIATTDNKVIVIPNGTISNSNVTNTTKQDERMLVLDFTIGVNTDIEKVREQIMLLMENDERVLHDMKMSVVVDRLTPVNIKMQAKAWTKSEDYWDVKYLLLEQISNVLQGFR